MRGRDHAEPIDNTHEHWTENTVQNGGYKHFSPSGRVPILTPLAPLRAVTVDNTGSTRDTKESAVLLALELALEGALIAVWVWAVVEAVRAKSWRWVATIAILPPVGVLGWFFGGRKCYGDTTTRE